MYCYTAYQLGISSPIPFPELVSVENASDDVVIRIREIDSLERQAMRNSTYVLGEAENIGTFIFRNGNEIIVEPTSGVEESLLRTTLLGPGMASLLRQRGLAVLHASSVGSGNCAVAFLGQRGGGKSTLAEAFHRRGYSVVTDDVMAVRLGAGDPQVVPGYPSIKLFPDAAAFLGSNGSATHRVNSRTEKRAHSVALRFPRGPLPLRRMYVLAGGDCNKIEPLRPQEAFLELVRNARGISLLKDSESLGAHLRQCARLAAEVPVMRLKRRRDLCALPEVIELIEKDLAQYR